LIAIAALAVLALACSETVGGIMQDAGTMLADAGDMMQPDAGAQDVSASCNKSANDGATRWAEFSISNPGQTEVTICYAARSELGGPYTKPSCSRLIAPYYEGTNTGLVWSCDDTVTSITVHN
jgi:hypothetical protein